MPKFKAILVDDEIEALDSLEILLTKFDEIEVIGKITNPLDVFPALFRREPDIIFMDVKMPKIDGIELVEKIKECCPKIPIIFVTAFENYSLEAARNNAFSYLLKPVNRIELDEVIKKVLNYLTTRTPEEKLRVPISSKNQTILVNPNHVVFFKAEGNYTTIKLNNGQEILASYNMGNLVKRFPRELFVRTNRSLMVNRKKIVSINRKQKTCCLSIGDKEIEINASLNFLRDFNSIFSNG